MNNENTIELLPKNLTEYAESLENFFLFKYFLYYVFILLEIIEPYLYYC